MKIIYIADESIDHLEDSLLYTSAAYTSVYSLIWVLVLYLGIYKLVVSSVRMPVKDMIHPVAKQIYLLTMAKSCPIPSKYVFMWSLEDQKIASMQMSAPDYWRQLESLTVEIFAWRQKQDLKHLCAQIR